MHETCCRLLNWFLLRVEKVFVIVWHLYVPLQWLYANYCIFPFFPQTPPQKGKKERERKEGMKSNPRMWHSETWDQHLCVCCVSLPLFTALIVFFSLFSSVNFYSSLIFRTWFLFSWDLATCICCSALFIGTGIQDSQIQYTRNSSLTVAMLLLCYIHLWL